MSKSIKNDQSKSRTDLIPPTTLFALGDIFKHGAEKYDAWNWRGLKVMRLYGAALRHMGKWAMGEDIDDESGMPHLQHALTNLSMLVDMEAHDYEYSHTGNLDNRPSTLAHMASGNKVLGSTCTEPTRSESGQPRVDRDDLVVSKNSGMPIENQSLEITELSQVSLVATSSLMKALGFQVSYSIDSTRYEAKKAGYAKCVWSNVHGFIDALSIINAKSRSFNTATLIAHANGIMS